HSWICTFTAAPVALVNSALIALTAASDRSPFMYQTVSVLPEPEPGPAIVAADAGAVPSSPPHAVPAHAGATLAARAAVTRLCMSIPSWMAGARRPGVGQRPLARCAE